MIDFSTYYIRLNEITMPAGHVSRLYVYIYIYIYAVSCTCTGPMQLCGLTSMHEGGRGKNKQKTTLVATRDAAIVIDKDARGSYADEMQQYWLLIPFSQSRVVRVAACVMLFKCKEQRRRRSRRRRPNQRRNSVRNFIEMQAANNKNSKNKNNSYNTESEEKQLQYGSVYIFKRRLELG